MLPAIIFFMAKEVITSSFNSASFSDGIKIGQGIANAKGDTQFIQKKLKDLGFYDGALDDRFGPQTERAVIEFQKVNNLELTGVVDKKTLDKIFSPGETKVDGHRNGPLVVLTVLERFKVPETGSFVRDALLAQILSHTGVQGEGRGRDNALDNKGPALKEYFNKHKSQYGKAWCQSGLSYQVDLLEQHTGGELFPGYEVNVKKFEKMGKEYGALASQSEDDILDFLVPGNSFIRRYTDDKRFSGHVMTIVGIDKDSRKLLIAEFNDPKRDSMQLIEVSFDEFMDKNNKLKRGGDVSTGEGNPRKNGYYDILDISKMPGFQTMEDKLSAKPYFVAPPPQESVNEQIVQDGLSLSHNFMAGEPTFVSVPPISPLLLR